METSVGVIVPPANIRAILEKTAAAVGKTPALEKRILQIHAGDSMFCFLQPGDPYHSYFREKVALAKADALKELEVQPPKTKVNGQSSDEAGIEAKNQEGRVAGRPPVPSHIRTAGEAVSQLKVENAALEEERHRELRRVPDSDRFTIADVSPAPTLLALDVLKLVSQFCVLFGDEVVVSLATREKRNTLFDFLKHVHPHYVLFQRMKTAYENVLKALQSSAENAGKPATHVTRHEVLQEAWLRHEWKRDREGEARDSHGALTAGNAVAIDWYDFVVLEAIDFEPDDTCLPEPISDPRYIPEILAAADAAELQREKNTTEVDMDMDVDEQSSRSQQGDLAAWDEVVLADVKRNIPVSRIRKSLVPQPEVERPDDLHVKGQPHISTLAASVPQHKERIGAPLTGKQSAASSDVIVRLPDGQLVPMSEATPALHAKLLDPKYKDERSRAEQKNIRQNLADGERVARNLARLAQNKADTGVYNRSDLQGSLASGRGVLDASSRVMLKKAIPTGPQLPAVRGRAEVARNDQSTTKRVRVEAAIGALQSAATSRTEDAARVESVTAGQDEFMVLAGPATPSGLQPEAEWLTVVGEKIKVCVKIPVHKSADWDLRGQEISMEVPSRSTIVKLKEAIAKTTRLPANKQKLQYADVGFLKDRLSLAYYNIPKCGVLSLEVKERGGRGKR